MQCTICPQNWIVSRSPEALKKIELSAVLYCQSVTAVDFLPRIHSHYIVFLLTRRGEEVGTSTFKLMDGLHVIEYVLSSELSWAHIDYYGSSDLFVDWCWGKFEEMQCCDLL